MAILTLPAVCRRLDVPRRCSLSSRSWKAPGKAKEGAPVVARKSSGGASLVAQWLRTHLPMQGTLVRALVREDPTCRRATKPVRHNYWASVPQLLSLCSRAREPQLLSPRATATEASTLRARAPQQEKPPQWEARTPQRRVAPACCN